MKAIIASLVFVFSLIVFPLFGHAAEAQIQISDFNMKADKTFSLSVAGETLGGSFADGEKQVLKSSGGLNVLVYRFGKMIVTGVVKADFKAGTGQIYIFEEMNSLFVPLTLAPFNGAAANFSVDLERMIEISRLANGGDSEEGLRKIVASFRQNPKQTVQKFIARAAARTSGPIPVGQRNRIQAVRSFEELEGQPAPAPRAPVRRRAPAKKSKGKARPAPALAPRAQAPLDLRPSFPLFGGR